MDAKGGYHADSTWRPLYKIGAVALLVEGLAYLTITVTSPVIGVAPGNTMKYLHALAAHSGTATFTYTVVAIADFALIPAALALYFALKEVSKSWMLLAAVIILTYVAIDISTFVSVAFALGIRLPYYRRGNTSRPPRQVHFIARVPDRDNHRYRRHRLRAPGYVAAEPPASRARTTGSIHSRPGNQVAEAG